MEHPGTVGRARAGRSLRVDEDGLIWCRAPEHARFSYYRAPDKTAAAWDGRYAWLAVVVFVNTLISLYYYLRWIIPTFRRPEQTGDPHEPTVSPWPARAAVLAAALSLAVGITAGPIWQLVS